MTRHKAAQQPGLAVSRASAHRAQRQATAGAQNAPLNVSDSVLALQRQAGNRAVQRLVGAGPAASALDLPRSGLGSPLAVLQAKLQVGPAGDVYEQEADKVARQVVSNLSRPAAPRPPAATEDEAGPAQPVVRRFINRPLQATPDTVRRHPSHAKEEEVQAKREPGQVGLEGGPTSPELERNIHAARGGGRPLDPGLQRKMEGSFAADFSGVKVHTDSQADRLNRSLQSRAFTVGQDVFFKRGEYRPQQSAGQQLLAHELTHVVQQSGGQLHRKFAVQRAAQVRVQRSFKKKAKQAGTWFKRLFGFGRKQREGELTAKYGVKIGGGGTGDSHFSHLMMDKVEKVLKSLPRSHTAGNVELEHGIGAAKTKEEKEGVGAASFYQGSAKKVFMNRPMSWMPWWLYTLLSPKHKKQRKLMDKGAMAGYPGLSNERDEALGLDTSQRSVFAGVSTAAVKQGGLATTTLRHELGHGVDQRIKFTRTRAMLPVFGGWRSYGSEAKLKQVATAYLEKHGVKPEEYNASKHGATPMVERLASVLNGDVDGIDSFNPTSQALIASKYLEKPEIKDPLQAKLEKVKRTVNIAFSQPWTFSDGRAGDLEHEGRVYHRDHYGNWASYLLAARQYAVSNYQFSSPGEWFAEAYASYYDPHPDSPARAKLNPQTKLWFQKNLGHYEEAQRQQPTLESDTGMLKQLKPYLEPDQEDEDEEVLPHAIPELDELMLEMSDFQEHKDDIDHGG